MNPQIFFEYLLHTVVPFVERVGIALAPVFGFIDIAHLGRLLLVVFLCGLIGLERSEHDRASGFRPHILVGLGACMMTLAGAYAVFPGGGERDPMRVASYVVSGVGFLGAGAILRHGTTVRGLTTASSLWGSAGLGIAVGAGMGWLAIATTLLILFTLIVLERLEARLGRGETAKDLQIHLRDDHRAVGKALTALDRLGIPVKKATVLPGEGETAVMRVELNRPLRNDQMQRVVQRLLTVNAITRVNIAALEVEDVDSLASQNGNQSQKENSNPQIGELKLDDDKLLIDLNEPEADEQIDPSLHWPERR
ncbi:MAG: MgtC/SapB family protein [Anaerolineales bacterium]|nr:MgtC/SapB family protein [Anaerolineales bacterium]MDW8447449.1 MgtC/SapB family protein [Anaerolineales bacterium]